MKMDERLIANKPKGKILFVRVENKIHKKIKRIAKENDSSIMAVTRLALDDYIENYDKENNAP
jgi:predicted transcriptional regulator